MGALFDDAAAVHDHDPVGSADGGEGCREKEGAMSEGTALDAAGEGLGRDFEGWESEGVWPEK